MFSSGIEMENWDKMGYITYKTSKKEPTDKTWLNKSTPTAVSRIKLLCMLFQTV